MRKCPNCDAGSEWLSYRLNGTTECQNCGYRSNDWDFDTENDNDEYWEES